jgi:hypothetical protein
MILLFAVLRIFMEDNPYGIQNQNPLGIMELSVVSLLKAGGIFGALSSMSMSVLAS